MIFLQWNRSIESLITKESNFLKHYKIPHHLDRLDQRAHNLFDENILTCFLFSNRDFARISITGDLCRNPLKRVTEKLHFL